MIHYDHVSKSYDGQAALADVSFRIQKGEFVFLTGPSGAGKSTVLRLMLCADEPDDGHIYISGRNIARLRQREIPKLRRSMGIVFQDFKLIERRTVYENVALSLMILGASGETVRTKTDGMLRSLGIYDKRDKYPRQISGGEQQRTAIARALVKEPAILLADEPTGNLDWEMTQDIIQLIKDIHAQGTTVIFATHNYDLVKLLPMRVINLQSGRVGG